MQFKVSRDDQEYGPYTIEELSQYVSEGSLLPNDYVHNGMEWVPLSEFLKNPHKATTTVQSVSSVAKAQPQINYTKSKYNPEDSGSESKNSLKSIVGAIIVIALLGYNFFSNRDTEKAEKFNNELVTLLEDYTFKLDSLDAEIEGDNYLSKWGAMINKTRQEIEEVPFYEGKKGLGIEIKNTIIEYLDLQKKFVKQGLNITSKEEAIKFDENESFENDLDKLFIQLQELQKQYAKNNNLELK
ncbi:MAG: hypothetical protein CBC36_06975 [Verrucomicrobiaceae bacterium TMED76]|nr:MAG: hypothetical protein CBC36_06975 [Verrucomicrobiaceae bacterium TMED76]|tara:strand:- start:44 stop:769 length:726 start_codon:yes stop_codon:yes gene_type:complete